MSEGVPTQEKYEWGELSAEAVEVARLLRENPSEIGPLLDYMTLREAQVTSPKEALLLTIELGDIKALGGFSEEAEDSYLDARVDARNLGEMAIHDALAEKLDNLPQ
jgi:hypothetical protein